MASHEKFNGRNEHGDALADPCRTGFGALSAPVAGQLRATTVMRNTSKAVPKQVLVGQNVSLPASANVKLSTTDLNNLMQALDIDVIA